MFSKLLPASLTPFFVSYQDFARTHFLKEFEKKFKGKQWEKTEISFVEDLRRLRMPNNRTQQSMQIDQLRQKDNYWIFKYDFRIAGTNESSKSSGNRIVGFINNSTNKLEILLIYRKNDLPKNMGETAYINNIIKNTYPDIDKLF